MPEGGQECELNDGASAAEVEKAAALGAAAENIFFSAPGKTRDDLERTIEACVIIADSYGELELLNMIAGERGIQVKAGLRINPNYTMNGTAGAPGKFGVDEESLAGRREFLQSLMHLEITGLHVHIQSQVLDDDTLYHYYDYILRLAGYCKNEMGWPLAFINFGSGLGVPYSAVSDKPLNTERLGSRASKLLRSYQEVLGGVRLIPESGRFLVCEAGQYATPVVDIKESRGVKYLIVQETLNGFLRPSVAVLLAGTREENPGSRSLEPLFTAQDAFEISVAGKAAGPEETVTIAGNLCTSTDVAAAGIRLPRAQTGDCIVFSKAGSYGYSLTPIHFSSQRPPLQLFLNCDGSIYSDEK